MKYKKYINRITELLKEYKEKVDGFEKGYLQEKQNIKTKAESMKGQWTDEYIARYIAENQPDAKYRKLLDEARNESMPQVLHALSMIKKSIDGYFAAPVSSSFADRVNTITATGLNLTDREFELLKQKASTYMEYRLLKRLGETRTKTEQGVTVDEQGNAKTEFKEVKDTYLSFKLPDIDRVYGAYEQYEQGALRIIRSYSGKTSAALSHLLENPLPTHIAIAVDGYFRNNAAETFDKVMIDANSILPESKVKKTLTENDKKLIDLLVDQKYPALVVARVKELAEADGDIRELLLLDDRYSKYLEESEE